MCQRHPTGIQRDDHVIETADTALAFGHQPWGERALPIPRHLQGHRAGLSQHRFGVLPLRALGSADRPRSPLT